MMDSRMMDMYTVAQLCFGYLMLTTGTAIVVYTLYKIWVERNG